MPASWDDNAITLAWLGHATVLINFFGVRILTEIYVPTLPLYPQLEAMPNREQAIETVRRQGRKVLVGYFSPGVRSGASPTPPGWIELGDSPFYALPLNLTPAAPVEAETPQK